MSLTLPASQPAGYAMNKTPNIINKAQVLPRKIQLDIDKAISNTKVSNLTDQYRSTSLQTYIPENILCQNQLDQQLKTTVGRTSTFDDADLDLIANLVTTSQEDLKIGSPLHSFFARCLT